MNNHLKKAMEYTEIPEEIFTKNFSIKIIGVNTALIENHLGIIHYDNNTVIIKLYRNKLSIFGKNMVVKEINKEIILLKGCIDSIKFENME